MVCPICGKQAKTPHGLRQHAMGTRPYGGHLLTASEAAFLAASASPQVVDPKGGPDEYLEAALKHLVANKKLPKYQFERAVDAFIGVFLPEIVAFRLDEPGVTLVAQEFPLKKTDSNLSTNVDYVLLSPRAREGRPWIFLELKTDVSSMTDSHALTYTNHLRDARMRDLLADITTIMGSATKAAKYQALLERFYPHETDFSGGARIVYMTPVAASAASLLPKGTAPYLIEDLERILTVVTFDELRMLELQNYPDAWSLFRSAVVPEVVARSTSDA